jgi:hypothetical protein
MFKNQKFIRMQRMSVATFDWKASVASPSNYVLTRKPGAGWIKKDENK